MPENDIPVLCHKNSSLEADFSHAINLPILKYIKEIEQLHQNLIKVRIPTKVKASKIPVRCRLVIVSKPEHQKNNQLQDEGSLDTILVSGPVPVETEPKHVETETTCVESDCKPEQPPTPTLGANESQNYKEETIIEEPKIEKKKATKHIHPCICDLTKAQREQIDNHLRSQAEKQAKFLARLKEIEDEFRLWEQEAEQMELYCEIQHELADGSTTCVPRRKRNFARRYSMVSLGVKQVINWKKPPKIRVKYNRVFELRKKNTKYCKGSFPEAEQKDISISEVVDFPATKTSRLRKQYIEGWIEAYNKEQEVKGKYPNRPEFVINHSKLWAKH